MAFVTLASSLTLVSLRLRLGTTRYRKEEDSAWQKDASLLRRTLLHYRRTTAMADDEYTTLPHRIRQREVNLPRTQWRSSCKMTFLSLLLSALDTTLINKYTSYVMWQCTSDFSARDFSWDLLCSFRQLIHYCSIIYFWRNEWQYRKI